jgi:hypothetical protein
MIILAGYCSSLLKSPIVDLLDSTIDLGYKLGHSNVRISATSQVYWPRRR